MKFLNKTKTGKQYRAPGIVIYGTPGIGKTTFAAGAPNPIILDLEGGSYNLSVDRIEKDDIKGFNDVINILRELYTEKHDYQTVVIDSIDWLERIIHKEIATEHGGRTIDDFNVPALGFGKGYTLALTRFSMLLNALEKLQRDKGMNIILVCHCLIKKFKDPDVESFDTFTLKLKDNAVELLREWADCILFARQKMFVTSEEAGFRKTIKKGHSGDRILHTLPKAAFLAKNRYNLPAELPLDFDSFWKQLTSNMAAKEQPTTKTGLKSVKTTKPNVNLTMGIPVVAYTKLNGSYHNNDFLEI